MEVGAQTMKLLIQKKIKLSTFMMVLFTIDSVNPLLSFGVVFTCM